MSSPISCQIQQECGSFPVSPPVALLATLPLQEGRQGSLGGGKSRGFGCCGLCLGGAGSISASPVSRGAGMGPSLARGRDGWEGGWWCLGWVEMSCLSHPNPFQGQSRGQSSPVLHSPQCWLEPDPSCRGSAFCGVRRARCEAFQLPQLGTGTLAKARPSLAICLPSVDGTGALFPCGVTRDVAHPVHHCFSVPGLGVPNARARAGEARGEDVPCRVQADVICAGALSTAWGCSQSSGSLCSV